MYSHNLKEPLLPKTLAEPPKRVFYDQAILAAFAWASSNFFFGILTSHDFATSCLQFSGYLLFGFIVRFYQIFGQGKSFSQAFFGMYLNKMS